MFKISHFYEPCLAHSFKYKKNKTNESSEFNLGFKNRKTHKNLKKDTTNNKCLHLLQMLSNVSPIPPTFI